MVDGTALVKRRWDKSRNRVSIRLLSPLSRSVEPLDARFDIRRCHKVRSSRMAAIPRFFSRTLADTL